MLGVTLVGIGRCIPARYRCGFDRTVRMPTNVAMRVLVFEIDGQRFGLDASGVREVLPAAALTTIPKLPPAIEGVLDVRGVVVPVIGMRRALGLDDRAMRSTDHLVLTTHRVSEERGECLVGLHVDHAVEIIAIDEADLSLAADGDTTATRIARLDGGLMSIHLVEAIVADWIAQPWATLGIGKTPTRVDEGSTHAAK